MNTLVDAYFDKYRGKRALVLGIGVSNRPLIKMLLSYGISVTACDKTPREQADPEVLELERQGAVLKLGNDYLNDLAADIVFRTPGMHPDKPELRALTEQGAELSSEMEAFFEVCPCKIIAVTGSDGKTTTTTIISELLKRAGYRVWIGGNIGQPLLPNANEMAKDDIAVVELSSFQLMTMKRSPQIAVVTNLAPNHLDVHTDMAEYIQAKENIFRYQSEADTVVLNLDNKITASFGAKAKGEARYFSRTQNVANGVFLHSGSILKEDVPVLDTADILLPGVHNIENYMAAICAVWDLVSTEVIAEVARSFRGVEHRIELVRELHGVRYYNDSIASSPSRTIAGLHSFDRKVILIAGGYDKNIPFDVLGPEIVQHVKRLILCGATAEKIRQAVEVCRESADGQPEIVICSSLQEAVLDAHDHAAAGDIVTLSPACAAFDQFKNFMVRGQTFKELVAALS